MVVNKACPSAFSNPERHRHLDPHGVQEVFVLGVFAEGCVRASVVDAVKLDYTVNVIAGRRRDQRCLEKKRSHSGPWRAPGQRS